MPAEEEAAAGRQHATRADCTEMGDRIHIEISTFSINVNVSVKADLSLCALLLAVEQHKKKREMKGDVEASPAPTLGEPAVRCQDVCRSYGKLKVLDNLNLTLPQGQIYGLLGPSGCGKTTMLKCIVGTLSISRGRISVLGKPPAFPGHGVPGRMVGYMPQELALYNEFTIGDTLAFYGRIHGLTLRETQARVSFLIEFLDLPQKDRLVRNLSGGQKRRVSLGAALLQKPELLILDEPTVGVDPVLRAKIWQHLADIVKEGKVSVIITTHYIEEARQANVVGLMRNGCLLAEGTPEALMKMHGSSTLEHAFLRLCETSDQTGVKRGAGSRDDASGNSRSFESGRDQSRHVLLDVPKAAAEVVSHTVDWKVRVQHVIPKWRNIAALTIKTLLRMKRMPGSLCFQFLLPVIQMSLICLCVGGDPKGIRVAVVNNETSAIAFSPSLLSFLDNSSVEQVSLSHAEAFRGIGDGKYWAVIGFSKNFSACLVNRMFQKNVSRETINGGSVHVWLDQTNRQIALMLQQKLYEAFQAFVENKLGVMAYMYALPIKFEEAIYGSQNTDFTTFVMPGAVLSIAFYLALGLTALSFVLERKEGLLDRCWVAGVSSLETMLAHLFSQLLVIGVQIVLMLLFVLLVFKMPNEGSLVLIVLLIVLQGITGISCGLVISAAIDDEQNANQAALGLFYPNLIMSGWGLTHMMVWRGFAVTLGWNTFFIVVATLILKFRK
ncbi:ABC transporter G family member 23 isoform X10 [Phyllopteryx taeniolatus]|uniref:ABC transporter G family member 23 isoform X10 n=1 Tax=Phyllopteryx taeniolatus TaxID=161469 RepID=UPI002AD2BFCC|nr:ABC transporter G family member 23 isoform X10 [Phyllopteryx taeniolatus]